jgi:hypothetical protein
LRAALFCAWIASGARLLPCRPHEHLVAGESAMPEDRKLKQQIQTLMLRSEDIERRSQQWAAKSIKQSDRLNTLLVRSEQLINNFEQRYGLPPQQDTQQ